MTLPESQWSKDNPGSPPRYIPLHERMLNIVKKAVEKENKEREKTVKPQ